MYHIQLTYAHVRIPGSASCEKSVFIGNCLSKELTLIMPCRFAWGGFRGTLWRAPGMSDPRLRIISYSKVHNHYEGVSITTQKNLNVVLTWLL